MEKDLKILNLDKNLRSLNSLPVITPQREDAYSFFTNTGRGAVSGNQIANGAVGSSGIAGSSITNDKIASNAIDARVIANQAINASEINAGVVQGTHMGGSTILGTNVGTNQIGTRHLDFAITASGTSGSISVGTNFARFGGILNSNFTDTAAGGTTEQDLMVHTLGTGIFAVNTQHVFWRTKFRAIPVAGTTQIKWYVNATEIFQNTYAAGNNTDIQNTLVARIGTGSLEYEVERAGLSSTLGTLALDALGSITLKLTHTNIGDTSGSAVQMYGIVKWYAA